jgi:hypothetical protein
VVIAARTSLDVAGTVKQPVGRPARDASARHASVATTERYCAVDDLEIRAAMMAAGCMRRSTAVQLAGRIGNPSPYGGWLWLASDYGGTCLISMISLEGGHEGH